jgi:hypothetical protein
MLPGGESVRHVLPSVAHPLKQGLLTGCRTLPSHENGSASVTLFDTEVTEPAKAIPPPVDMPTETSGIYSLIDAHSAFG